ncbi:MAG: SRPBCC family protein [Deltaproteobacteria bacterium]|nr:SRPBCC family protein [Deltaproteobacteria bacterium]MBP7287496.1 SRPBCC family protein [Nannocystaceae bacterium]
MNASITPPSTSTANPSRWDLDRLVAEIVRRHTEAPLRMTGSFVFDADTATVFEQVTDPARIAEWFGLVKGGSFDHAGSCNPGTLGAGTRRVCHTRGMGDLDETFFYYDAPYACVYRVKNAMMPVVDHAAVMVLEPLGPSRTRFTWQQYYNLKGVMMRFVFPSMLRSMMNRGLATLTRQLGGEPSEMVAV